MLSVEGLRHTFGEGGGQVVALDGVSFTLMPGQALAIFGPNGAGKTTLLKVLAGLIRPQAGSVQVTGGRRAIGWIGHQSHLYEHLTVRENLLFWASLYGVPAARRGPRAAEVLGRLGMRDRADRPVWSLSRGLAQRAAIAKALIHDPSVLLLDEPFTGLDRGGALALGEELGKLRDAGAIVVVVTHDLEAIAGRTDHVVILRRGQLVFEERGSYDYERLKGVYHQHAN